MLLTKTTRTVNIDLWNYWHFAFIGAVVYFATDSILWGFFAAVICYIITLILADYTADKFQGFYDKMEGISIPQPFCAGFVPFALIINKVLDKIPGFEKLNIDAEGMKKKFGLLGEPLLGILGRMWHRCIILQERTRNSRQDSLYSRFRYQDGSGNGVDSPYYQPVHRRVETHFGRYPRTDRQEV